MPFVDLAKAFDNVKWYKLFEVLRQISLNYRDRKIIFNLCKKQVAIISLEDQEREAKIRKGVRQGCRLSLLLFNVYIDEAIKEIPEASKSGITIQGERINGLNLLMIIVVLPENREDLETVVSIVLRWIDH